MVNDRAPLRRLKIVSTNLKWMSFAFVLHIINLSIDTTFFIDVQVWYYVKYLIKDTQDFDVSNDRTMQIKLNNPLVAWICVTLYIPYFVKWGLKG
jgi:hypothetical protein